MHVPMDYFWDQSQSIRDPKRITTFACPKIVLFTPYKPINSSCLSLSNIKKNKDVLRYLIAVCGPQRF